MKVLGCACCLALFVSACADSTASDCANWDLDLFDRPTETWCYIRMYRCADHYSNRDLSNYNAGDLTWAAGGKHLGAHTCAAHGKYMQIWRVAVKREIMRKKPRFTQCKNNNCGCGLTGKCGGKKPAVNFGWRYKFPGKLAKNSKRQFSLPGGSRKDQWDDLCLERVVRTNCVKKLTYKESNMESASAIFKRDVIDSPIDGCQSLTRVNLCTRFAGKKEQEVSKKEEEQECQAKEEEADKVEDDEEKEGDPFQEEERKLKWRWAENQIPLVGMVKKKAFEDAWNMPEDRAALVNQLQEKVSSDPEAGAKQYRTRAVEFADVDYPEDRRTFADYTEALKWLEMKSNDL